MIDDKRVAAMTERLDVTEGLYEKMSEKYCLILENLLALEGKINGHPEETLKLLEETTYKIQEIQSSLNTSRQIVVKEHRIKWWFFPLLFVFCVVGSLVGDLLFFCF